MPKPTTAAKQVEPHNSRWGAFMKGKARATAILDQDTYAMFKAKARRARRTVSAQLAVLIQNFIEGN